MHSTHHMTGKLPWNIHAIGCTAYREVPLFRKRGAFQTPRVHPCELVAQHKKRAKKTKLLPYISSCHIMSINFISSCHIMSINFMKSWYRMIYRSHEIKDFQTHIPNQCFGASLNSPACLLSWCSAAGKPSAGPTVKRWKWCCSRGIVSQFTHFYPFFV